jgi:NADH-quinone oxidoreductase subunit J
MEVIFYIAAAVSILAALNVVLQRTPIYSALSLIVVLASGAVMYLLLEAPFIAMIQVIIYAGAIMVLFTLVIMLLNAGREAAGGRRVAVRWLGIPLLVGLFIEIAYAAWRAFPVYSTHAAAFAGGAPREVGNVLFRSYVLPFEATSVLILVAILGAVVLAKKQL